MFLWYCFHCLCFLCLCPWFQRRYWQFCLVPFDACRDMLAALKWAQVFGHIQAPSLDDECWDVLSEFSRINGLKLRINMFLRILLPLFLPDLHVVEFKVKEILHTLETPGLLVSSGMFDEMAGNQVCYHNMLSFTSWCNQTTTSQNRPCIYKVAQPCLTHFLTMCQPTYWHIEVYNCHMYKVHQLVFGMRAPWKM